jgi:lysophospholipase
MTDPAQKPPALETRFLEPAGWRWGFFTNGKGKKLRYGMIMPQRKPDGVVVVLPGLSEFCEKYFEIARAMLERNLGVFVLDWRGQGKSDRYLGNPHKRHSAGLDEDVADLHQLITQHVQPAANDAPLVMLAHSMGGNIGLRYMIDHPGIFTCAALSSPMLGIQAARLLPTGLRHGIATVLHKLMGDSYIFGGGDWQPDFRDKQAKNILSSDPVRSAVHNAWCVYDPALQVGNATFRWLHEALISCHALNAPGAAEKIAVPCLIAVAGKDRLVDNAAILRFSRRLPDVGILALKDANHEILMERDEIRDKFLWAFDELRAAAPARTVETLAKSRQTQA